MRLSLLLLTLLVSGCGAFADAANCDGGTPDAGATLKVRPQYIYPGQLNEYELTFALGPPWNKGDCKSTYVTTLDMGGSDIEYTTKYQGGTVVNATLHAKSNATTGERAITATVACEKPGQPQQTHGERGRLFVLELDQQDGGTQ